MGAAKTSDLTQNLTFSSTAASILAIALALVSIAQSIKVADVCVFLGEKDITTARTLLPINVKNIGNDMGNLASVFIEIEVEQASPITFKGATGLAFEQTTNLIRKQFRFDDVSNPKPLYPAQYIWMNLGFIQTTPTATGKIKFSVQIVGTQGRKKQNFEIDI